jgi:hypothetical protein
LLGSIILLVAVVAAAGVVLALVLWRWYDLPRPPSHAVPPPGT